jgi:hypothetical protein
MRANLVTLLPLALSLVSGVAVAATVYRWVDAQGIVHYSDQPHPQAQVLDVQPKNLVSTPVQSSSSSSSTSTTPAGPDAPPYRCDLIRPENDEVFLNTSTVSARVQIEPQLAANDQIAIAVDGKRLQNQPTRGTEFIIQDVERGTHTIMIAVYDSTGKNQLCTTSTATFHVRQPSTQAPVKAVRPKF